MSKVENAVQWAVDIAENPRHGYDQIKRWGDDYDCSSLVITAFEENGIPVKSKGKATYTGNMYGAFKKCGFEVVEDGSLKRGDVLLNKKHHTAIYLGDNKVVMASINEKGTITGGETGDQTGREILVRDYYVPSYGWDVVLRYPEEASNSSESAPVSAPQDSSVEVYKVKAGDTLGKIGAKYGVSVSDLARWNDIKNPDMIIVGQEIKIYLQDADPVLDYFEGRVTTARLPLNIRKGSSMNSPVIGSLPRGAEVKIAYETAGWGKLYGREGFVSMSFITKM